MAGTKITELAELTAPAVGDWLAIVDISDLAMAATGTDKKINYDNVVNRLGERTITTAASIGVADSGKRVICTTASVTHTVVNAATLGAGFACEVINDSGGTVTLDGSGATNVTLAADECAVIICCNAKVRVTKGTSTVVS